MDFSWMNPPVGAEHGDTQSGMGGAKDVSSASALRTTHRPSPLESLTETLAATKAAHDAEVQARASRQGKAAVKPRRKQQVAASWSKPQEPKSVKKRPASDSPKLATATLPKTFAGSFAPRDECLRAAWNVAKELWYEWRNARGGFVPTVQSQRAMWKEVKEYMGD